MIRNLINKKISSTIGFIIVIPLFVLFLMWQYDSFKIILVFLIQYFGKKDLYTFFGVVFGGFIAFFALLFFPIVEKTKYLIEKILFNPAYIDQSSVADKEYKLWMYVNTFNAEILRFFNWEDIKKLIKDALYIDKGRVNLNYEGENYKDAFHRFKNIINNFSNFFYSTIILIFLSLISLFLMFFFDIYYIKLLIGLFAMIVFLLSLSSLIFAALIIKFLFLYGSGKEIEKFKKEIFNE